MPLRAAQMAGFEAGPGIALAFPVGAFHDVGDLQGGELSPVLLAEIIGRSGLVRGGVYVFELVRAFLDLDGLGHEEGGGLAVEFDLHLDFFVQQRGGVEIAADRDVEAGHLGDIEIFAQCALDLAGDVVQAFLDGHFLGNGFCNFPSFRRFAFLGFGRTGGGGCKNECGGQKAKSQNSGGFLEGHDGYLHNRSIGRMKEGYFIPLKTRKVKKQSGRKRTGRAPLSKAPGRQIYIEKGG